MASVPLGARSEHRSHALCGRVCLPGFLFREFVQAVAGDEARVSTWARGIVAEWGEGGAKASAIVDDEPVRWWRKQWKAYLQSGGTKRMMMATDTESRWPEVFDHLRWILGNHDAHQWFGTSRVVSETDTEIVLDMPAIEQAWIQRHYAEALVEACEAVRPGLRVVPAEGKEGMR
jgi:hypothetical protein